MNKILVINKYVPPQIEGVAILLGRLLKYFPENSCIILCDKIYGKNLSLDMDQNLPFTYYYFYQPECIYRGKNPILHMISEFVPFLSMPFLIIKGLFVIKKERINRILAANSSGVFLISAYYISKLTGRQLYVYLFDVFKYSYLSRIQRGFARLYEKKILKSAERIFVTSEKMQEHYKNEYGLVSEVMCHPVAVRDYRIKNLKNNKRFKIVFTGRINKFTLDSLYRLVSVIKEMNNVELNLYIPDVEQHREIKAELTSQNVTVKSALVKEIPIIQRNADVLFSPMGFDNNRTPVYRRTASPGKIGEYLVSGVPILINAPDDSYISWYGKTYGFAYVVNSQEEKDFKDAISFLLSNKSLREKLVENALKLVKRHDAKVVSKKLQSFLLCE